MKENEKTSIEVENELLNHPAFFKLDLSKHCPKYTSILQRKDEEGIEIEDLKSLQNELEQILVSVMKRKEQLEVLIHEQCRMKKTKKAKKSFGELQEKQVVTEERPSKKLKDSNSKAQTPSTSGRLKCKNVQLSKTQDYEFSESHVEVPKVQKNDGPNRFWSFIEPYCSEITRDDIKVLEEWIKSHEDDSECQNIPPLGDHFAIQWPRDDILEEMKEGYKTVDNEKMFNFSNLQPLEGERLLKQGENECVSNYDHRKLPLLDRLVSSLVEENLMTPLDDQMTDTCQDDNVSNVAVQANFTNSICLLNGDNLEKRLRKEFIEQGVLEADDETNVESDNELMCELKRLQFALIPLIDYNLIQKKKLLAVAKAEMTKQEIRKHLQEADAKVMEAYRTIASARQKGRKLNKKEQDQAFKTLEEREKLLQQLENVNEIS